MTRSAEELAETAKRLKALKGSQKLRPSGGYRKLASFQTATLIYDATWFFCEKFLDPRSRMADQMVQAARSGRQNIAEGSRASATTSQTELRLINVARASLEELLLDFEDYLRHRHHPQWPPDSDEARAIREVPRRFKSDPSDLLATAKFEHSEAEAGSDLTDLTNQTDQTRWNLYAPWLEHDDPAIRANAIICLIHQANFLLDRQIAALEKAFLEDGGYSEQLATARLAKRQKKREEKQPEQPESGFIPDCPRCGEPMVLRTAKTGKSAGQQFWGCPDYPKCKGVVPL